MKQRFFHIALVSLLLPLLTHCEQDIENLDVPPGEKQLVVEGYIEPGGLPLVMLTESTAYFSEVSIERVQESFIHDADVWIARSGTEVKLREVHSDSLPQGVVDNLIGGPLSQISFSFYTDTTLTMIGQENRTYDLRVEAKGETLTASTTIQPVVPLDSIYYKPHPNENQDNLVSLFVTYSDPPNTNNYFRYFTKRNSEPFYPGYLNSLFDDNTVIKVDGETIDFAIERGYPRNAEVDLENYSYFERGDTVVLRWAHLPKPHFEFWQTLEYDLRNQGNPFVNPSRIKSNVEGGLGIWGAYTSSFDTLVIPE